MSEMVATSFRFGPEWRATPSFRTNAAIDDPTDEVLFISLDEQDIPRMLAALDNIRSSLIDYAWPTGLPDRDEYIRLNSARFNGEVLHGNNRLF